MKEDGFYINRLFCFLYLLLLFTLAFVLLSVYSLP
jgi:hypothetical protein